jgi:hypothetical protein
MSDNRIQTMTRTYLQNFINAKTTDSFVCLSTESYPIAVDIAACDFM